MHALLSEVTCVHMHDSQTRTLPFRVFVSLLSGSNVSVCVGQQGLCPHSQRGQRPHSRTWTLGETQGGGGGATALTQVLRGPLIFKSKPRPPMPSQSVRPPSRCGSGLDTLQLRRHKLA